MPPDGAPADEWDERSAILGRGQEALDRADGSEGLASRLFSRQVLCWIIVAHWLTLLVVVAVVACFADWSRPFTPSPRLLSDEHQSARPKSDAGTPQVAVTAPALQQPSAAALQEPLVVTSHQWSLESSWNEVHRRRALAAQLRLQAYHSSYRATTKWPVWVDAGDAHLRLLLHPARIWSMMADAEDAGAEAIHREGEATQRSPRASASSPRVVLTGSVELTVTLHPVNLSRTVFIDMDPINSTFAAWKRYERWAERSVAEMSIEEASEEQRIWSIRHDKMGIDFVGLDSRHSPFSLTLRAHNGTHRTFSSFDPLHRTTIPSCIASANRPSFNCPLPLLWPVFPLSYSTRCRFASPLSADSSFSYFDRTQYIRHFPMHPDPTTFIRLVRSFTGHQPQLEEGDAFTTSFGDEWQSFSAHYASLYAQAGVDPSDEGQTWRGCDVSDQVLLSSPLTRMLIERTAISHWADLLHAADAAPPALPEEVAARYLDDASTPLDPYAASPYMWSAEELRRWIPSRRLLPMEKSMLESQCSPAWWNWYWSFATSHLLRVQQSRSSPDNATGLTNRWPQTDSELLEQLLRSRASPLPLQFTQLSHIGFGISDDLKAIVTTVLESILSNRVFVMYDAELLDLYTTSLQTDPLFAAPALFVFEREGELPHLSRSRTEAWSQISELGFNTTEGFYHDQRTVEEYEGRKAWQLTYTEGSYFGLTGNIVNSTLYKPFFTSLSISDVNVHGCVFHSYLQVSLFNLLDSHLDTVDSALQLALVTLTGAERSRWADLFSHPSHMAELHPLAFRLSLISTLLRPDWFSIGVQIRDGDLNLLGQNSSSIIREWDTTSPHELLMSQHVHTVDCVMHRVRAYQKRHSEGELIGSYTEHPLFVWLLSDKLNIRRAAITLFGSRSQQHLLSRELQGIRSLDAGVVEPSSASTQADSSSHSPWSSLFSRLCSCQEHAHPVTCELAAYESSSLLSLSGSAWLNSPLSHPSASLWLSPLPPELSRERRSGDMRDLRLAAFDQWTFSLMDQHVVDHGSFFGKLAAWQSLNLQPVYGVFRGQAAQCWKEEGPNNLATTVWAGWTPLNTEYYKQDTHVLPH